MDKGGDDEDWMKFRGVRRSHYNAGIVCKDRAIDYIDKERRTGWNER